MSFLIASLSVGVAKEKVMLTDLAWQPLSQMVTQEGSFSQNLLQSPMQAAANASTLSLGPGACLSIALMTASFSAAGDLAYAVAAEARPSASARQMLPHLGAQSFLPWRLASVASPQGKVRRTVPRVG